MMMVGDSGTAESEALYNSCQSQQRKAGANEAKFLIEVVAESHYFMM